MERLFNQENNEVLSLLSDGKREGSCPQRRRTFAIDETD